MHSRLSTTSRHTRHTTPSTTPPEERLPSRERKEETEPYEPDTYADIPITKRIQNAKQLLENTLARRDALTAKLTELNQQATGMATTRAQQDRRMTAIQAIPEARQYIDELNIVIDSLKFEIDLYQDNLDDLTRSTHKIKITPTSTSTKNSVQPATVTPIHHMHNVVPSGLPTFDGSSFPTQNPEDFLERFEIVLQAHGIELDTNWHRLFPICLGQQERFWSNKNLLDTDSWRSVKTRFTEHYGNPHRKQTRISELWRTSQQKHETIREYCDRYQKLLTDCEQDDRNPALAGRFLMTLPVQVQQHIEIARTIQPDLEFDTISSIINVALRFDALPNQQRSQSPEPEPEDSYSNRGRSSYCDTHGWGYHSTAECRTPKLGRQHKHDGVTAPVSPRQAHSLRASTTARVTDTQVKCDNCKKTGHILPNCPEKQRSDRIIRVRGCTVIDTVTPELGDTMSMSTVKEPQLPCNTDYSESDTQAREEVLTDITHTDTMSDDTNTNTDQNPVTITHDTKSQDLETNRLSNQAQTNDDTPKLIRIKSNLDKTPDIQCEHDAYKIAPVRSPLINHISSTGIG